MWFCCLDLAPDFRRSSAVAGIAALIAICALSLTSVASGSEAEREEAIKRLESTQASRATAFGAADSVVLHARDRELERARAARTLILLETDASGGMGDRDLADPLSIRAIALSIDAYSQALLCESVLLASGARSPAPGARPSRFPAIWNEAIGEILGILAERESLWKAPLPAEGGEINLQSLLLSLCLPQAYEGDAYALPRGCLPLRSATLPESIAACCMDPEICRGAGRGTDCASYVAGIMSESIDQDAMVGFRYGKVYWSLPKDASPRTPARDGRVAASTARILLELIEASEAAGREVPAPGGGAVPSSEISGDEASPAGEDVSVPVALGLIRGAGKLWPAWIDPFATVPGLRNPRWREGGGLLCDVALYESTLEALHPRTRAWLLERLGPERRTITIDSQ